MVATVLWLLYFIVYKFQLSTCWPIGDWQGTRYWIWFSSRQAKTPGMRPCTCYPCYYHRHIICILYAYGYYVLSVVFWLRDMVLLLIWIRKIIKSHIALEAEETWLFWRFNTQTRENFLANWYARKKCIFQWMRLLGNWPQIV